MLAGYGSCDKGTRITTRNGFASGYLFGSAVALSGDRDLIEAYHSDEKVPDSGVAYIFHRVNGAWKE